jgi:hypothetical protein
MKLATYMTTSWGRRASVGFARGGTDHEVPLRGTFYVTMIAENGTMTAAQIRELSLAFDIYPDGTPY